MIEGMIQIGNAVLAENGDILSNLIEKVEPKNKKDRQRHVLKLCFYTNEVRSFKLDVTEEIDKDTGKKYNYIGSADGPAAPQWFAASARYDYHLTETMCNLCVEDLGKELNDKIKYVFQNSYVDLGEEFTKKNRYILNLKKLNISEVDIFEAMKELSFEGREENEKQKAKRIAGELKKIYSKELDEYIKREYGLKSDEIGLCVIYIDDIAISQTNEYREAVIKSKQKTKSSKNTKGVCSICGTDKNLTSDLSKMQIKYYTTNQVIFASELKDYNKNMLMCSDCLNSILSAENYIKTNLDTRLMGFNVYLIPHFIFGNPLNKEQLDSVCHNIKKSFNTVKSVEAIEALKQEIQDISDIYYEDNSYFLINIMFYKRANQATKIQKLIKDVNPSIFREMLGYFYDVGKLARNLFGENYKVSLSLTSFYFMTPIRVKSGEPMEYRSLLQTYEAIFRRSKILKLSFIKNVIACAKIKHFNREGYNINEKASIESIILKANFCIKFLEYMGCMEKGENMDMCDLKVNEDMKAYISEMNYKEEESALFLLGCLIGEIGNAQYKNMGEGRKPILNKLNFGGIDKGKLKRLSNEVFNKLNEQKIRQFNEITYGECKRLMDLKLNNWSLNKHENLFYILSGYSYSTTKVMLKGGKKDEQQ